MKTKAPKKKTRSTLTSIRLPAPINRRREWRFELPLEAAVAGRLAEGKTFLETAILRNISSGGAYFCLNSGVVVGTKLTIAVAVPSEAAENQKIKLKIEGTVVRLEKPDIKGKKQGVAVRFAKGYKFIRGK